MLSEIYPTPSDLVKNETKTLQFLRNNATVGAKYPVLSAKANEVLFRTTDSVDFESYVPCNHAGSLRRVHLGARVSCQRGTYDDVTYYLLVARSQDPAEGILRKFHFDVACGAATRHQPHPLFHVQYPGTATPYLESEGFTDSHFSRLDPWMSEPRIPSSPMTLALLIDIVFREFPDEDSRRIHEDAAWRGLVRRNQNLVLKPFYERCADIFRPPMKRRQLIEDVFYVR